MIDGQRDGKTAAPDTMPGTTDSALLILDALSTLMQIGRLESRQWLEALPELLVVGLYRLPLLLLTWLSFGTMLAAGVYLYAGNVFFAALAFFILQCGLMLLLERRRRTLQARMVFRETRRGFAALRTGLQERFDREGF